MDWKMERSGGNKVDKNPKYKPKGIEGRCMWFEGKVKIELTLDTCAFVLTGSRLESFFL